MKKLLWAWLFCLAAGLGTAGADVLETRQGERLFGVFAGGDQDTVFFKRRGHTERYPKKQVKSLFFGDFSGAVPQSAPAPAPAPVSAPAAAKAKTSATRTPQKGPRTGAAKSVAGKTYTFPVGTRLKVITGQPLSSKYSKKDFRFFCRLAEPLSARDTVVLPIQTGILGRVAEASPAGPKAAPRLKLILVGVTHRGGVTPLVSSLLEVGADMSKDGELLVPAGEELVFTLRKEVALAPRQAPRRMPAKARPPGFRPARATPAGAGLKRAAPKAMGSKRTLRPPGFTPKRLGAVN